VKGYVTKKRNSGKEKKKRAAEGWDRKAFSGDIRHRNKGGNFSGREKIIPRPTCRRRLKERREKHGEKERNRLGGSLRDVRYSKGKTLPRKKGIKRGEKKKKRIKLRVHRQAAKHEGKKSGS